MNPYIIIAFMLALAGAGAGGFKLGADHEKAGQVDKIEMVAEAVDAANKAWASAVVGLKPKYTTIQNEVQHEIRTNTIYGDCKLTERGLLLANQALDPTRAFSFGDGKLPNPDAPK